MDPAGAAHTAVREQKRYLPLQIPWEQKHVPLLPLAGEQAAMAAVKEQV